MKELQELIKNGELSETLMSDKKFVKGAKEILKSENIEVDDKKLTVLMNEIENKLKAEVAQVSDEELENVAGGVTKRGAIIGASSVIGAAAGALFVSLNVPVATQTVQLEAHTGGVMASNVGGGTVDLAYPRDWGKTGDDIAPFNEITSRGPLNVNYSGVAATVGGAGGGALVGGKIGQLICDKFGIV